MLLECPKTVSDFLSRSEISTAHRDCVITASLSPYS